MTVNGRTVRRTAARIAAGDVITVALAGGCSSRSRAPRCAAQDLALDILFEDEHFIAINKPPGIVVHPTYRHATGPS